MVSDQVVDICDVAGIKKPEPPFVWTIVAEIQGGQRKNLVLELLKKILSDDIRTRSKWNNTRSRNCSQTRPGFGEYGRRHLALPESVER